MSLNGNTAGAETCPVCGANQSSTIYADARDPITLDHFRVMRCSVCSTAFTAPRPASLDRYYPSRYRAYGTVVTRVLRTLYDLRVSRWTRLKPEGASVLEVGCGPGLMLAAFKRRGWRVLGIERNEAAAEMGRTRFAVEIVSTSIEELPADLRFDLIILFQVLEHIGEPVALLNECGKRLAPGGNLIINVPNFGSWQAWFAGSKWLHLDVPRHLVHYTPQTLATTLDRAGFRLSSLSFASLEHDPYGWVESTSNLITRRPNTLTRFLMGLDRFGLGTILSILLGVVLLPFAVILSIASWVAKKGALIQATAASAGLAGDEVRSHS
jgi:2-polyprenyl-3-methyl-5-hydroxy-6-metoxy-1,4-benzoquinol methylase